jgi:5-methylcytosine-specific restriction enzyme subunit McrC
MVHEALATESQPIELSLSVAQVEVLQALGKGLASASEWWGGRNEATSVVDVTRLGAGRFSVRFRDVIGVVRLGDLQIAVRPKIDDAHFLHLIRHSDAVPKVADDHAAVESGMDYASLLAHWCVTEAEGLLRRGLGVGYSEFTEELDQVRGRLDVVRTFSEVRLGRCIAVCEFEELGEDTPLNRIVKAACRKIAGGESFSSALRRRATSVVARMGAVGELHPSDRNSNVSRLTRSYSRCLPLAKLVLAGQGLRAHFGNVTGSVFLMRTPELVEDGLRNLLRRMLPHSNVRKQRLLLSGGGGISMNPDLLFGAPDAVGDVKYRLFGGDWERGSLYQGVTFATAFRVNHCGVFSFVRSAQAAAPRRLQVGSVAVEAFNWIADAEVAPAASQQALIARVAEWVASFGATRLVGAAEAGGQN